MVKRVVLLHVRDFRAVLDPVRLVREVAEPVGNLVRGLPELLVDLGKLGTCVLFYQGLEERVVLVEVKPVSHEQEVVKRVRIVPVSFSIGHEIHQHIPLFE
ncbi:MAG: hypothetical protein Q6373_016220 [Candidatus Sigynarchaeota archaeon]